MNREA
ncbi:hypothetical protein YPPY52_1665, partial [Yersinia pestis PY-52]